MEWVHMERAISKPTAGILALAFAFVMALALAPQAHAAAQDSTQASDLQAAALTAQASKANNPKEGALPLLSGQLASGKFQYQTGSYSQLDEYWYKYQTSNLETMIYLTVTSLDRNTFNIYKYDDKTIYDPANPSATSERWDVLSDSGKIDVTTTNESRTDMMGKGEWLFFRISPSNSTRVDSRYTIKVTEYPIIKQVAGVKKAKATKNSLTVKWGKQKNATKYQVKYRIKGGKWKTKTVKKNSVKLSKLKKNKKYQIKVRAYCANGYSAHDEEISNWGGWSAVKTFKTKK